MEDERCFATSFKKSILAECWREKCMSEFYLWSSYEKYLITPQHCEIGNGQEQIHFQLSTWFMRVGFQCKEDAGIAKQRPERGQQRRPREAGILGSPSHLQNDSARGEGQGVLRLGWKTEYISSQVNSNNSKESYLLPEHCKEEIHEDRMLPRILLAEGADSLDHHNLSRFGNLMTAQNNWNSVLPQPHHPNIELSEGLEETNGIVFHALNSSEISDMKDEICFMSRSMLLSLPVFRRVVMARVAMLRLESVTRFSKSRLQAVTADGCFMAT